jgi:hypothetical protein
VVCTSWNFQVLDARGGDSAEEALAQLRGVEDVAGDRVGEDEIWLAALSRALEVAFGLACELVAHSDAAAAMGLR